MHTRLKPRSCAAASFSQPQPTDALLPAIYKELRRLAGNYLRHERPGHTLQATALVHDEAYLRLADQPSSKWQDRTHFFVAAAQVMRHILIDHAPRRHAEKHGGAQEKLQLNEALTFSSGQSSELVALLPAGLAAARARLKGAAEAFEDTLGDWQARKQALINQLNQDFQAVVAAVQAVQLPPASVPDPYAWVRVDSDANRQSAAATDRNLSLPEQPPGTGLSSDQTASQREARIPILGLVLGERFRVTKSCI
jgi:RNA polymerase sigma factor (TIGR02999 family)